MNEVEIEADFSPARMSHLSTILVKRGSVRSADKIRAEDSPIFVSLLVLGFKVA